MSTFTMTLSEVIDQTGGTTAIVNGVSKLTGGNIGIQYYPIFDETYRDHLTGRIIDHFWNREIGAESVDMFQLFMRRRMNEIMPYYNTLYLSTKIEFDPLSTVDLHTISTGAQTQGITSHGTNNTTTDTKSTSRSVTSETPQTMLSGDADYATGAADVNGDVANTSDATEDSTSNVNASNNGDTTVSGYQGSAAALLLQYRETLINIDLMVISELEELFMGVWDNGDSYTNDNAFGSYYC